MRFSSALIGLGSIVATAGTLANAFMINKQFYPAIVYITKSNASMSVIYLQSLIVVYFLFQLFRKIFFGELRAAEADHLSERSWHAVLETCLAFTVFRDDFSPVFVMQFVMLLFVKCFHWLSDDRVDMMERSPVITLKFHVRLMSVICFMGAIDSYFMSHAYFSILTKGASSQIVFGFEYAILITLVLHVTIKYILHMHDLRTASPWEAKAVYLLYAELVINLFRCILYGAFALVMMKVHTFPLFSIRPFYLSVRALHKAFNDVVMSRRAINAMNNLFPVVSTEELSSMDSTCIICREEMTADSQPKRLPCSHVFHANCLRSWFQRQQTCPTCRTDILGNGINGGARGGAAPQAGANNGVAPQNNGGGVNLPNFMPFLGQQFAFHAAPQAPAAGNNQQPAAAGDGGAAANQPAAAGGPPFSPPPFPPFMGQHGMMPPFMPPMPPAGFMPPPPPMPAPFPFPERPTYEGLSDEELRQMEGTHRAAVESRLRQLENIAVLLDAAGLQMQQYLSVVGRLPTIPTPTPATPAANSTSSPPGATNEPPGAAETTAAETGNVAPSSPENVASESESSPPPTTPSEDAPSSSRGLFKKTSTENSTTSLGDAASPPAGPSSSVSGTDGTGPATSPPPSGSPSTAEEIRQRRLRRFADDSTSA